MFACKLPRAVYAGDGALSKLKELCAGKSSVAVFSDRGIQNSGVLDLPLQQLKEAGISYNLLCDLPAEPSWQQAQVVVDAFHELNADMILAVGGGSVMDIAKLCSITAKGKVTVKDLLDNHASAKKQIYSVMIPTTAGTGAEATPNAIVAVPEKELKVGIVCEEMIPDAVILDGEMIRSLPMKIAASTGLDALCHAIECYTSKKATPFSDLYAMEALKLIFSNLENACLDSANIAAKNAMLIAAYYGGVAITCSGTTAVHALSYPLGGKYHIAHGVANAILLAPVMRFNLPYCVERFAKVYDAIGETSLTSDEEKAEWLLKRMEGMVKRLEIPTDLKAFGVKPDDLETLVAAGMDVQRLLQNNLRPVTADDARRIYSELLA